MYLLEPYDDALMEILRHGRPRTNVRTGIKTLSIFGMTRRYRLDTDFFPIVTRRKVWPYSIFGELLWFISGSTNNNDLEGLGSKIWRPWVSDEFEKKHCYAPGDFGPVYGFQLRHFGATYKFGSGSTPSGGFDQLDWMVRRIKEDPSCRRILFSLWNPGDVRYQRLPPCHFVYQVCIDDDGLMTGIMTQRSCDFPIGVPANIQFYAALTKMLAQQTGYKAHEFVHETHDSHIYWDQIPAMEEYLSLPVIDSPKLAIVPAPSIFSYMMADFVLSDFSPGPVIKIPVAV